MYAQKFGHDPNEVTGFNVSVRGWKADRLDRLNPQVAAAMVIREIERVRPAAKGQLEFGAYQSWWQDPFSAGSWSANVTVSAIPIPAAVWLFGTALAGLLGFAKKRSYNPKR
ncbi:MAG: hypothetical protein AB8G17_03400 [Gammaproteobacteria bacterium]